MKRYRVLAYDFDTRARILSETSGDGWDANARGLWEGNRRRIIEGLAAEFGAINCHQKVENFTALGVLPFSLIAFHNAFFRQARSAFVIGAYYPALTAVCALGERVLNHLILLLREDYKGSAEYKKVYRKDSFDDWDTAIDTLVAWEVLLPKAAEAFRALRDDRHRALHFDPTTDTNDRALALDAIAKFNGIVTEQFSAFGTQPWYIPGTKGAIFVKKEYQDVPFVKRVVVPNCGLVGYKHLLDLKHGGWLVQDANDYEAKDISDEEFKELFNNRTI